MYFFNVHVIRNVLKRPWRKIYIPISAFSFILFSPAFVLICFLPQKTYFGFWEHKWGWGGGRDLEKSFLILYALTDISLDELGLKLINSDRFSLYNFTSHIYILCTSTNVVLLVYLHCWKTLEGLITIHLHTTVQNFILKLYQLQQ